MTHELKTDKTTFDDTFWGRKLFEIRFNDREYCVGDILILRETVSTGEEMKNGAPLEYTGRVCRIDVKHMLKGPVYGLMDGWVIMSHLPCIRGG